MELTISKTTYNVLEAIYWLMLAAFVIFMLLRNSRREALTREQRDFQRGLEDGKQFKAAGMDDKAIEAFLECARKRGTYGAYESGVFQVIGGEK